MEFAEIAAYMTSIDGTEASKHGGNLTNRLYEIAFYDNHVPQSQRVSALQLLEVIKDTMKIALSSIPDALTAYHTLNASMEDNVRRLGIGSLSWKIQEFSIPPDEIVSFIARPENIVLLEDFYSILAPEIVERLKGELERRAEPR